MSFFKLKDALDYLDPLKIDSSKCLRSLSPLSSCQKCADICPTGGLSFEDGVWKYDKCLNCGLCAYVCPQKVFSLDREKLAALKGQRVLLKCAQNEEKVAGAVEVHCLVQFTLEEFVCFVKANEEVALYLPQEKCAACSGGFFLEGLLLRLAQLKIDLPNLTILDSAPKLAQWQKNENKQTEPLSRRGFFSQLSAKGQQGLKDLAVKGAEAAEKAVDETLAKLNEEEKAFEALHLSSERQKFSQYLIKPVEFLPYHGLKCDKCNFCSACQRLCPGQALKIVEEGGEKRLTFAPQLCNECDLCREVCLDKGLYWDELKWEEFKSDEALIIAKAQGRVCQKCEREFWQYPSQGDLCRFCQD